MLSALRRHIPAKQTLKWLIVDPIRTVRRNRRLRRGIERLRAGELSLELLAEIRSAWGNEGFSADLVYTHEAARLAATCQGPILECGTGLTTLVCGAIAERRGIEMYSLEQDESWLAEVRNVLFGVPAKLMHAPLTIFDDHVWYDVRDLPKSVALIICDGPYVSTDWPDEIHRSWRYGVLPAFTRLGSTFETMLLDDADEPRAAAVLLRWTEDFGTKHRMIQSKAGDCAIVTRPG